jgi:FkbH-like protein
MYRAQAQRKEAQAAEYDYPAMMQSLELRVSFGTASAADLPRVTELIQRTNQFNTTTRRYDRTTLTRFMQDPTVAVYVAELRDRFGSMGLVAVVIVKRDGNVSHLDSFVMSCRAMGFALERLTLGLVMQREGGDRAFHGEFIRTDRNTPAARLFAEAGFTEKEPGHWWFRGVGVTAPGWFRVLAR